MRERLTVAGCLVFSGASALVYQIIWVRLLGFSFGTTTAAVSTVLAVFFGGLALGNLLAANRLARVQRPLRVYALLELGIGLWALLSVPLLRSLDFIYAVVGTDLGALALTAVRFAVAAAVLLPPTMAMGATLPVVARGLVTDDAKVGRWSAILYAANTLGAVAGAYLCGFWLIPSLGLWRSVLFAAAANLGVAALILATAGARTAPEPAAAAGAAPASGAGGARGRGVFLLFFGISGFVAIGYEIVWSKVFGIVMEGTLYGFAAVLSGFLLGIAAGSFAIAPYVDRIRDLPRAFGLLHVGIAIAVLLGILAVPDLPWWFERAAAFGGGDAIHVLYLLVLPLVLLPTALFGAAFPVLIRIYAGSASAAGRGIGIATAVNTAGSIAASLMVGFWWIPAIGMDRSLLILLGLDAGLGLVVLALFTSLPPARRAALWLTCAGALFLAWLPWRGVQVDRAVAGRFLHATTLAGYRANLDHELASQVFRAEGKTSVVTVYAQPKGRLLRTNGLPEAGYVYAPPYYPSESMDLGILPYLMAEGNRRALLVGLGGGNTLEALTYTALERIDVVELEPEVVAALGALAKGRANPLEDPRVHLALNDGRNELLLARYDGRAPYDVITSQPSHPWRVGAANLFTEEYFRLAHALLAEGGCFAVWVNGFRMDAESLLAIAASFERVFPGSLLFDLSHDVNRDSFLLLGGRRPLLLDVARIQQRMREPGMARLLGRFGIESVERMAARIEGPLAAFVALAPRARNDDDGAFVETRIPRNMLWKALDYAALEAHLPKDTPVLPPLAGSLDLPALVRISLDAKEAWRFGAKLERLLAQPLEGFDPVARDTLLQEVRLRDPAQAQAAQAALEASIEAHPERVEPRRALAAQRARSGDPRGAAEAYAAAWERSGAARDAVAAGRARFDAGETDAAFDWFERVPAAERERHPEIVWYEAWRTLERGSHPDALDTAWRRLLRFRDSDAGLAFPGMDELLARLAYARGDLVAARGFSDLAEMVRREQVRGALGRASRELRAGRLDAAAAALREAEQLRPSDLGLRRLRVRLALAQQDPAAAERAIDELRRWSRSRLEAIVEENRLREQQGLPLLSEKSMDELWSGDGAPLLAQPAGAPSAPTSAEAAPAPTAAPPPAR